MAGTAEDAAVLAWSGESSQTAGVTQVGNISLPKDHASTACPDSATYIHERGHGPGEAIPARRTGIHASDRKTHTAGTAVKS